jgi:hypothetical protein
MAEPYYPQDYELLTGYCFECKQLCREKTWTDLGRPRVGSPCCEAPVMPGVPDDDETREEAFE